MWYILHKWCIKPIIPRNVTPTAAHVHMAAHLLGLNYMAEERKALCSDSATVQTEWKEGSLLGWPH